MSTPKEEEIKKIFSERIKELVGNSSVSGFAREIGLNQAAIDRYTKCQRTPAADALVAISSKCGVSVDWLLGLTDTRTPSSVNPIGAKDYEKVKLEARIEAERAAAAAAIDAAKKKQKGHMLESRTLHVTTDGARLVIRHPDGTTRTVDLPDTPPRFTATKTAESTRYLDIIESQQRLIEHLTHRQRRAKKDLKTQKVEA